MQYAWKIAAAGLLAAGVAICFIGILPPHPPLAFAEIAAKLRDARTITCQVSITGAKQKEPAKIIKLFFKEPGRMRFEGAGEIGITDERQNQTLLLDSKTKTAMLIDHKKNKDAQKDAHENVFKMIDWLRKLTDKKGESAGKKRIGETETEGFRVEEEGFQITVWGDPKSRMPVQIDMPVPIGNQEMLATLSDFQLDAKADDALFLLKPPEDYKLRKMELKEAKLEEDVVQLLRAYAGTFDGKFPKSLSISNSDWQTYINKRWGKEKPKGMPEPEFVQFMQQAIQVEMSLRKQKNQGYKPDGVKLGDRDKIIFWYRPDKTEKYRAVYGDLHVADVTTDQLPEKSKK